MAEKRERVDPEAIRQSLLKLAELIHELEKAGQLLDSTPELIRVFGNLRSQLFEYEVRCTGRLLPEPKYPPEVFEAERIVEEAARRLEEEDDDDWWRRLSADPESEDDG